MRSTITSMAYEREHDDQEDVQSHDSSDRPPARGQWRAAGGGSGGGLGGGGDGGGMEVMGGMEGISMEVEGLEMERDMLRVSLLTNLPGHLWRAKWTTLS